MDADQLRRILSTWASTMAELGRVLADQDPTWGTEVFELAGGVAALHGNGLYVNRLMAAGIDRPIGDDELDVLIERSSRVGVAPQVDVSPLTHDGTRDLLTRSGFRSTARVRVLARPVPAVPPEPAGDRLRIERADGELLPAWQDTAAAGWGHATPAARRASDAYTEAAAVIDRDGLLLVTDRTDDRPVACASVTIADGLATLGGMSTVSDARGRGIQSALVRHRLGMALARGCDLAAASTAPDSGSERNLRRHGFEALCTLETWSG